ncbi:endonuclease domain-containing protein [Devosia ginsengisoli]|uniref:endonuclease domain-containing protein n=1 Tax=Devosia ginsengisoli TaxID=400770 RepID=UPI0026F30DDC|nr:DUF559 domain-containing protein [Devosia ginsengisoli]MCR6670955.1 DUF559 domain-containing protein [Devosia ginsengisoli]
MRRNPTDAEQRLWSILRARQLGGHKFVRQVPIGPYFADFVCREAALIIEVDGGQHAGSLHDKKRTAFLTAEGYSVLRCWNNDVLGNLQGVAESILAVLASYPSPDLRYAPATLSPQGRGEERLDCRHVQTTQLSADGRSAPSREGLKHVCPRRKPSYQW